MVSKMHLAKVVIAVIAMPIGKGITHNALPYRLIIVIVFSLLCLRGFLLLWLRLHTSYASKFKVNIIEVHSL